MRHVSLTGWARSRAAAAADRSTAGEDELVALAPAVSRGEVLRRFWPWARQDRWWLLVGVLLLAGGAAGEVVSVWLFKDLIDEVLVPRRLEAFWLIAGELIAAAGITALMTFLGNYTTTWVAERFVLRLRTSCVEHLHTLPPDTLRSRWHGDVVARMTNDIESIEEFVASGIIEFASAVISLVFFTTAAFFLSWPLALAVLATAPLFYLSARFFADRVQDRSRESVRREGRIMGVVEESLANATLAHAYNQQRHEVDRVHGEGRKLVRAELATARVAQAYPAFLEILEVLGGLAVMGFGAFLLSQGSLTIGGLIAFAAFLTQLFSPASQLSQLASDFGAASAGAERIIELAHMRSPVRERADAIDRHDWRGELTCAGVSAGYPTRGTEPVLRDVTFTVAPGEVVALTGPSGAGKSTLAKLFVRFMDPDEGSVRLDGIDLRDLTLGSVRDAVTLLPQSSQLFRASVRENIAYGRPGATDEEVVQAARDADAHEFILALPQGYHTVLGQDGLQLSGGQARRIGIARAFLRATAVLVLDEPTSDLDKAAAMRLVAPLRRLMAGRTTVLITHDPALAARADSVFALNADGSPRLSAARPRHRAAGSTRASTARPSPNGQPHPRR
jgi:ABC-type multidrug transport system fused ATPase/permease subunit